MIYKKKLYITERNLETCVPNCSIAFSTTLMYFKHSIHRFADSATAPIERCCARVSCLTLPLTICIQNKSYQLDSWMNLNCLFDVLSASFCVYPRVFRSRGFDHRYVQHRDRWTKNLKRRLHLHTCEVVAWKEEGEIVLINLFGIWEETMWNDCKETELRELTGLLRYKLLNLWRWHRFVQLHVWSICFLLHQTSNILAHGIWLLCNTLSGKKESTTCVKTWSCDRLCCLLLSKDRSRLHATNVHSRFWSVACQCRTKHPWMISKVSFSFSWNSINMIWKTWTDRDLREHHHPLWCRSLHPILQQQMRSIFEF